MPSVLGRDAIYFLARRHWLIFGMLSNLCSPTFLKDLWVLSLVFPWVSLFYFLRTLERLPTKYAGFNGCPCFSWIFLRMCSSTHKNSLIYFCSGFLFRDITSKMLKNVSLLFPFSFLSHALVSFGVQTAKGCFSCVAYLFIVSSLYIHSLWNFLPIQGLTFFSLIFYLLSSLSARTH